MAVVSLRSCATKGSIYVAMVALATIVTGCGLSTANSTTSTSLEFSAVPNSFLRAGDSFQYVVSINGTATSGGVNWSIVAPGGVSSAGSLSPTGLYTAPSSLQAPIDITIEASVGGSQVKPVTSVLRVLPAVPQIMASNQSIIASISFALMIAGVNFTPQTEAFVNGSPGSFTYLDPNTASVSATGSGQAVLGSIVLQNPWDTAESSPFEIGMEVPETYVSPNSSNAIAGQILTGCFNPNTQTAGSDWGTKSAPVYTTVNNRIPTIGAPAYGTNSIFWVSRETEPGQSVLLSGAFTGAQKKIRIAPIPPGTVNWQAMVTASETVVAAHQMYSSALSFPIPASLPPGVYGFAIEDPTSATVYGLANTPSVAWSVGTPASANPNTALLSSIHDCGGEPGGVLRIFGKNFTAPQSVTLASPSGSFYTLAPTTMDTNSMQVQLPNTLSPGIYRLWLGTSKQDATSSPAYQIVIFPATPKSTTNVVCPKLVADGKTDNSSALQACLDSNAPAPGSNAIVHINLPAGTFVIKSTIKPHPYEVLSGASTSGTTLLGQASNPPTTWISVPQYFGMTNLTLLAPANPYLLASSDGFTGNPLTSGHLFIDAVDIEATADASGGQESLVGFSGPDVQIYNSTFAATSNTVFNLVLGDGSVISGNQFIVNGSYLSVRNSQNVIFENNEVFSENPLNEGPGGGSGGQGLSISRAINQYARSALSQNVYVAYNDFHDMGTRGQQIITNDGGGGAYFGPVASSTSDTVVLANDPAWNWSGNSNPQASTIAIISGTGVGQYSTLSSVNGRTVGLSTPWKILPDSTSIVVISQYQLNMTIAHNTIENTLGTSILLSAALEGVIEDNVMNNSGSGVLLWAFGPYGGPAGYSPMINNDVLRNSIATGAGTDIVLAPNTNVAGIGVLDMPGILVSGLLIRDNSVSPAQTIFSTNGANGINAALAEHNTAIMGLPAGYFMLGHNTLP